MKEHFSICCVIVALFLCIGLLIGLNTECAVSGNGDESRIFIIDAGHGGADGGAVSCKGTPESVINLQIANRLIDTMHLIGLRTKAVRTEDCSVDTEGNTIASRKASDIKNRVKLVNATNGGILISIHQNQFSQSRYSGAQVFYGAQSNKLFAETMQNALVSTVNPGSNRKAKVAKGVYLMEKINKPGILIECGFLSNPAEEAQLKSPEYQKKLSCVIASVCSVYSAGLESS